MDDSEQQFYRGMQEAPRLLSGILFLASMILLGGGFDMGLPSFFTLGCSIFFAAYCGILLRYAPADNWLNNFILIISHPFYWVLTIAALLNAMKRMAFAQMGWLKSNHQPCQ